MSNQIEFRHLRYFQALSKELHFKKAADKLYISQPGLSRQIKQLEELIGAPLFERDKKHVDLTEAGRYFEKESKFLLNALENMVTQTTNIASGAEGELKIGFVGSAMQNVIPNLIIESTKDNPGLSFSFEEMRNAQQVERLLSNEIDLGFVRLDKVPDGLKLDKIYEDTFSLVLPKDHFLTNENFKNIKQVSEESFILFQPTYSPAYYRKILSICADQGFKPNIVHNSVHASTIYRLVEHKLGISIVPTSLKDGYNMNVKFIELTKIKQKAELSLLYSEKNRNPALKNLLDIIYRKLVK